MKEMDDILIRQDGKKIVGITDFKRWYKIIEN